LGRAPLSDSARKAIVEQAAGYCTLEYDLATGKRGRRGTQAEELLMELTGADDVLIVNNCAGRPFFVLTVFAAGGEVVISRGELVEIGGDFRVPDVLSQSGAALRE
jgi:L-seryl-tRNA(Ser) seleniumtransferase